MIIAWRVLGTLKLNDTAAGKRVQPDGTNVWRCGEMELQALLNINGGMQA